MTDTHAWDPVAHPPHTHCPKCGTALNQQRWLAPAPRADALLVGVIADVLTELHVRNSGGCSESHMDEAEVFAALYLRRLAR